MTTYIEAMVAALRSIEIAVASSGRPSLDVIERSADALESTAADRDRLGEALFEAYLATGADPDGATDWRGLFRPMTSPTWSEVMRLEIERIREEADEDVARAETERDVLRADLRRAQECIDATKNMLGDEKRNPAMRLLGIVQAVIAYYEGNPE